MKDRKKDRPEEAPGNPEPQGTEGGEDLREPLEPAEPSGGSSLRAALLFLLLAAAAAAGVLTYLGRPQPAGDSPAAPTAEKRRIAIPKAPDPAEEIQTVVIDSRPIPLPVPPTPAPPSPSTPPGGAIPPKAAPPSSGPAFALETDAFVLPGELAAAEKKARRLGLSPVRVPIRQTVTLTRLRAGEYPPTEAEARRAELAAIAPGPFSLPRGDKVVVYAATYADIDKARSFADRLYQKGIRLEEEEARVPMTVHRLRLGRFPDRAAAERAASRARGAGLETGVIELR